MQLLYQQYQIAQRNLVLSIRLKDQAFETDRRPARRPTAGNQAASRRPT